MMGNPISTQVHAQVWPANLVLQVAINILAMPISDAIQFIQTIKLDKGFRDYIYSFKKQEQMLHFIQESGFNFSTDEFHASYNLLLLKCQFEEDASLLNQVCNSYLFMLGLQPLIY